MVFGCGHRAPGARAPDASTDADPAAGEPVELKLDLDDSALAQLGLDATNVHETRTIWFYDTPALAFYDAGVLLRARKLKNGADDTTVKARPMLAAQTPAGWLDRDGAKCEVDRTIDHAISSCSLTRTPATGLIDEVASGKRAIAALFDSDEQIFLGATDPGADLAAAVALGPIPSTVWKVDSGDAVLGKLALERWLLPAGGEVIELSTRVAHDQADAALAALLAWTNDHALVLAPDQSNKTRTALEQLAPH